MIESNASIVRVPCDERDAEAVADPDAERLRFRRHETTAPFCNVAPSCPSCDYSTRPSPRDKRYQRKNNTPQMFICIQPTLEVHVCGPKFRTHTHCDVRHCRATRSTTQKASQQCVRDWGLPTLYAKVQLVRPSPRSPAQERYLTQSDSFCSTGDARDRILGHMRTRRLGYFSGPLKGIPPLVAHLMISQRCFCTPK